MEVLTENFMSFQVHGEERGESDERSWAFPWKTREGVLSHSYNYVGLNKHQRAILLFPELLYSGLEQKIPNFLGVHNLHFYWSYKEVRKLHHPK